MYSFVYWCRVQPMKRSQTPTNFDDKRRLRRFVSSPWILAGLCILIVVAGWNTWDMYQKWRLSEEALEKTRVSYGNLEKREMFLDGKIESLSTEGGIEAEVRERFGVAKPGEGVIVVLSDDEEQQSIEEEQGWWARMKGWFSRDD
jgi:cell division protein FtsB